MNKTGCYAVAGFAAGAITGMSIPGLAITVLGCNAGKGGCMTACSMKF
nr:280_t:CDS:2 [Entrophospora candida]